MDRHRMRKQFNAAVREAFEGFDPETKETVRGFAKQDHLSIKDEMLHLLRLGLEAQKQAETEGLPVSDED